MMRCAVAFCLLSLAIVPFGQGQQKPKTKSTANEPVIDMHLHALHANAYGPPPLAMCTPFNPPTWDQRVPYDEFFTGLLKHPACSDPVWSAKTDAELMERSIASTRKANIVLGVLSGSPAMTTAWRKAAPKLFLAGLNLSLLRDYTPEQLEQFRQQGSLDLFAEVTTEYQGIAPTDDRLEPYWAFAEKNDIPVGIHVGPGPYGDVYLGDAKMRMKFNSALSMEEVLNRHPKMRVYLMHAGYPLIDDLLAVLYMYPQVYVDTGAIIFTAPRDEFYQYIQRIVQAGFAKRIMFGSDQMVWPETIERSVKIIEDDPLLTKEQKRDILYNNAARFLRLTPEQRKP